MLDSTQRLLASKGYQGASVSAVLADSGAPRGSFYHYFPGGKDELIAAAIAAHWQEVVDAERGVTPVSSEVVVRRFVASWRTLLQESNYSMGCSLVGLTVSAPGSTVTGSIFEQWHALLRDQFTVTGMARSNASTMANLLLASCEGAVVLCRARRTITPLDLVEDALVRMVASR